MAILGNIKNLIEDGEEQQGYTLPAVVRKKDNEFSFPKALCLSIILHPLTALVAWLIVLILLILGVNFTLFEKPKIKTHDIEFVLVDREDTPINKNTKYRSDRNSRAGGKHDPNRKVSIPTPAPAKTVKPKVANDTQKLIQKKQQQIKQQAPQKKAEPVKKPAQVQTQTQAAKPSQSRPAPPTARPSVKPPSAPKVVQKPQTPFAAPVPPSAPIGKTLSSGPIGGSGTAKTSGRGGTKVGSGYAPTPSLSPTKSSGSGSRLASSGGSGNVGNPGPGNPNGRPGIDAIREPDFGPYMRELQRRIKMNWDPPKGNESKRVVLLFKIAKDGRLLSCRVYKSSGLPSADRAALNAVEATAPFKPLPAGFSGSSVDIQFTFDYNVFGATGYK